MTRMKNKLPKIAFAAFLSMLFSEPVTAQGDFPTRPIKIVLPVPAGSALDIATRAISEQLSNRWGQQVVVETRPGGGGLIAAQVVASASPDGYTLLGGTTGLFNILPAQKNNLQIDVNRAFVQIGMITGGSVFLIAVSPKLGISAFPEFVELARQKPGQIAVGTNGAGTLPHLVGLALQKKGDIPINIVPYNQGGTMAAVADILGGRIHGVIEGVAGLRGQLQSGDLKPIGQMGPERSLDFPEVPAVAETIPGFSATGFLTLSGPVGISDSVILRLSDGLRGALESAAVKQRYADLGSSIRIMTPTQTKAFVENEQKIWWPLVRELSPQ